MKSRVKSRASSVQFPAHQLKKLHFLEKSSTAVKQFMNENPIIKKKMLKKLVFLKKHRLNRQLSTFLGVRESSVSKQNACEEVRKQRKDCTSEENTEVIRNFFQRTDISTNLPTAKRVKKDQSERRVLDRPIVDVFSEFQSQNPDVGVSLSTFKRNRPTNVETTKKQKWVGCLCEMCANVDIKLKVLSQAADRCGSTNKVSNKFEAVSITMCNKEEGAKYHKLTCIQRKCTSCSCDNIVNFFQPLAEDNPTQCIGYSKWERVKKMYKGKEISQIMPVSYKHSITNVVVELSQELEKLAEHLFVASWQQNQFLAIQQDVPESWVVLNMDFAENYSCVAQQEVQSAHWAHNQVTVHPTVAYYRCQNDECEKTVTENILFVSDDKVHDAGAVQS